MGDITLGANAGLAFEYSGDRQIRAFPEEHNTSISNVVNKTQYMSIAHGVTNISGLNVTGSLLFSNNIPTYKVGLGDVDDSKLSTLSNINTSTTVQAQLNTKQPTINYANRLDVMNCADGSVSNEQLQCLNDLVTDSTIETRLQAIVQSVQDNTTTIGNNNTSLSQDITDLETALDATNTAVSNIETDVTQLRTDVDNIDLSGIATNASDISQLETDLTTMINTKADSTVTDTLTTKLTNLSYDQNVTTISSDLHTDDVVINDSLTLDGTFIISNVGYTVTNQQFSYLKDIDENVKTSLDNLSSSISTNSTNIGTLQTDVSSHGTRLDSAETTISSHTTDIDTLQTDVSDHETRLDSAETTISAHTSTIGTHTSSISSINSTVTGLGFNKQDLLSSSNRLNSNLIADGSISNLAFQTLYGIDTNQSIQDQIDTLNTTLSTLDGLQDLDITNIQNIQSTLTSHDSSLTTLNTFKTDQLDINTNVSTSITDLDTNKQAVLSNSTKLNPAFINAGSGTLSATKMQYLSTITSDVQNQIDALTSNQGSTYNGSNMLPAIYVSSTYGIQDMNVDDALADLRSGIDYNAGSITSLQNSKQAVIDVNNQISMQFIETTAGNTLSDYITQNNTDKTNINSTLSGKQATINSSNKLDSANVSYGMTNVSSTITSLATDIGTLFTFKTNSEISTNDNTNAIGTINTTLAGKQNTIDVNNKLASTLISTNVNSSASVLSTVLQSLTDINTTQSTAIDDLNDNVTALDGTVSGHTTSISTINTNITNLQSADGIHDTAITAIQTDITNLQTDVDTLQDYTTSNNTTISGMNTSISNLVTDVEQAQTDITALGTSKQNVIDTNNKLLSSNVDYSASALRFVDISSNLQAQLTSINGTISTLTTLQNGDVSNFLAIDDNFVDVNNAIALKQDIISNTNYLNANLIGTGEVTNTKLNYIKNVTSDIQAQIDGMVSSGYASISYDSGTTTTTITNKTVLATLEFGDTSQQTTAFTSAKNTDLSNTKTKATDISYSASTTTIANTLIANGLQSTVIDTINTDITNLDSAKQNVLNSTSNKLDGSYLNAGSGTMSNTKLQYLSTIASDYDTTITGINSAITSLQSFDTSQATLNLAYTTDISTLYGDKQNLLSDANKLNPVYINAGTGSMTSTKMQYLSSIGGDITDALAGKHNTIDGSNKLASSLISTNINATSSVLNTVLQSLTDINTNQSSEITTINDEIVDLQNADSGFNTRITTNETNITSLLTHDGILDGQITDINTELDTKQNRINTDNKLASTLISTNVNNVASTLNTVLSGFHTDIADLQTTKQDVIDVNNKLNISNVDISASNIRFADYGSSINTKFTSLDDSISTLTTLQSGDATSFTQINADIDALETAMTTKQNIIDSSNRLNANLIGTGVVTNTKLNYLQNVTSDIQAQINGITVGGGVPSISYDGGTTTTTIADKTVLTTLEFGDASQQTTAFTSAKNTDISNTKTKATNISYATDNTTITGTLTANTIVSTTLDAITTDITSLESDITTLQSTTSGHTSSISTINTNITNLQAYDSAQTTLNTGYANDIATLYADKQNILSDSNKLNPSFIDTNGVTLNNTKMGYLSSIASDLQTQLDSKIGSVNDGSLTIAKTNNLQETLDSKLNDMVFVMAMQPMYNVSGSYSSTFSGGTASLFDQNAWCISSGNQSNAWSFVVQINNAKLLHGCKYLCMFQTLTDSNLASKAQLSIDTGVGNPTTYTSRLRYDQGFKPSGITILSGFTQANLYAVTDTPLMFNFTADTTNGTFIKIFCDTKGSATYFLCEFSTFNIYKMN